MLTKITGLSKESSAASVPFASSVMYAGVTTRETLKAEDDGGSFTRTELGAGGRPEEFFATDEWDEKDVFRILPRTEGPATAWK